MSQHEIQDFMHSNFSGKNAKISKLCDIYSLGNIMFKLLTGKPASVKISKVIAEKQLHLSNPRDCNVF